MKKIALLLSLLFATGSAADTGFAKYPLYGTGQWKASVASVVALPATGNTVGDTRIELTAFGIYSWNGSSWVSQSASGSGTVTSASVVSANGFAGSVATATTTPAITLSTTVTGVLKGNGTAISAATSGTDYAAPLTINTTPKTTTYAATSSDCNTVLEVNPGSAFTVTMPNPSTANCEIDILYVASANYFVTINPYSTETFGTNAFTAVHESTPNELYALKSDGTNWQILRHYAITKPASFTMALNATTTNPTKGTVVVDQAYWWRNGDRLYITWAYQQSAAGTAGSGTLYFTGWPTAFASSMTTSTGNYRHAPGEVYIYVGGYDTVANSAILYNTTSVAITFSGTVPVTTGALSFAATGTSLVGFDLNWPVTNWEP